MEKIKDEIGRFMYRRLEPKLIAIFREGYSKKQFYADCIAGVIVGLVALPMAIAFAIASYLFRK